MKKKKKKKTAPRRKYTFINKVSYKMHLHLYLKDKAQDTGDKAPLNCIDCG